jgi:hypothetical protein
MIVPEMFFLLFLQKTSMLQYNLLFDHFWHCTCLAASVALACCQAAILHLCFELTIVLHDAKHCHSLEQMKQSFDLLVLI